MILTEDQNRRSNTLTHFDKHTVSVGFFSCGKTYSEGNGTFYVKMPYPQRETIIHITVIPSKAHTHRNKCLNVQWISLLWTVHYCGAIEDREPKKIIKSKEYLGFLGAGTAVAQWLRCCDKNRKFAGSIPVGVIGIFHWHKILPIAL